MHEPVLLGATADKVRDEAEAMTAPRSSITRLKRRTDFLKAAKGRRCHVGPFTLQAGPAVQAVPAVQTGEASQSGEAGHADVRFGFTLTKKVGKAVVRNRARRRLKEAVRLSEDLPVVAGHDYVLVGRIEALRVPFNTLKSEISRAIRSVHCVRPSRARTRVSRP